jgi:hypothetical protein
VRLEANRWQSLEGSADRLSTSVVRDSPVNNIGQGVAILEDVGADLLAFSGRDLTTLTDLNGGVSQVADTSVHIRNLDGSTTGLSQIVLTGDEDGIGTPWSGDIKNLAFGFDDAGRATLLVVDLASRRLDVYQVPEPAGATLAGLALLLGVVMRRGRRGR